MGSRTRAPGGLMVTPPLPRGGVCPPKRPESLWARPRPRARARGIVPGGLTMRTVIAEFVLVTAAFCAAVAFVMWLFLRRAVFRSGQGPKPPAGLRIRRGQSYKEAVQEQVRSR